MDYNKEIKCYRCGDKFGRGHMKSCKALDRVCFSCNKVGHLSSVCRTKTVAAIRTVHVFVRKSAKRQLRDQLRYREFKNRKSDLAELPFSHLAPSEFAELDLAAAYALHIPKPRHTGVADRIGALKVHVSKLQTKNAKLSSNIENYKTKNKALEKKISGIEFHSAKKLWELQEENKNFRGKLNAEQRNWESVEHDLRQQLRVKEADHSKTVANLNEEIDSFKQLVILNNDSHSRWEKKLKDSHQAEITRLEDAHKEELKKLKASLQPPVARASRTWNDAAKSRPPNRGRGGNRRRGKGKQVFPVQMQRNDVPDSETRMHYFSDSCFCP